jgi:dihydrofolate reductase
MSRLVFGMNQSLDGYVDHERFGPLAPGLFRHYIEHVRGVRGMLYGRRLYQVMQYWDEDSHAWGAEEREYADAWRSHPKWVVSRTLKSVGPNATLVGDDLEGAVRRLKADGDGEIDVAGPELAHSLGQLGLIDEYRLYMVPVVLGQGKPFFAGSRPPLRFAGSERIGEAVIRLRYVPA